MLWLAERAKKNGHNQSTCPEVKEYIRENPDSLRTQYLLEKRLAAKERRCSYCRDNKHTIATCKERFHHLVQVSKATKQYRIIFARTMRDLKIGLGSLMRMETVFCRSVSAPAEEGQDRILSGMIFSQNRILANHPYQLYDSSFMLENSCFTRTYDPPGMTIKAMLYLEPREVLSENKESISSRIVSPTRFFSSR